MPTALVVGKVPEVITQTLLGLSYSVKECRPNDPVDVGGDIAVVHEGELSGDIERWLAGLYGAGVPIVYHADAFETTRIVRRLIRFEATHFLEGAAPSPEQVEAALLHLQDRQVDLRDGDFVLGTYCPPASDGSLQGTSAAYEGRRLLSMVSPCMGDLVRDVLFAVRSMALEPDGSPLPEPPFDPHDLVPSRLATAKEGQEATLDNRSGKPRLSDLYGAPKDDRSRTLLGGTPQAMAGARNMPPQSRLALIRGESGSGKTLAATLMWQGFADTTRWARDRAENMPFVRVNCGGMTVDNFDHQMLGTGPSIFTGVRSKVGHFGRADYGVLFLDEFGDLSAAAQSRFKPLLDDLVIDPPGLFPYPLHTRVLAATNVELESAARGFQHDLLRRFRIQITVPGLNARTRVELLQQIDYVAQLPALNPREFGVLRVQAISAEVVRKLLQHDWSHGNFRELQEVVQSAVGAAAKRGSRTVEGRDLTFSPKSNPGDERVVNVRDATLGEGRQVIDVAARHDLVQASRLLNRPIYRLPTGVEIVLTGEAVLRHRADSTPEGEAPPSGRGKAG